ncbi:MAG: hypothetical protein P4M00_05810 [Azospirillaceae bacterium]|nr:hypothetical protein [Azospirillaceae bacterium]
MPKDIVERRVAVKRGRGRYHTWDRTVEENGDRRSDIGIPRRDVTPSGMTLPIAPGDYSPSPAAFHRNFMDNWKSR